MVSGPEMITSKIWCSFSVQGNMAFAEMLCETGANISALTGRNLNGKESFHSFNFEYRSGKNQRDICPKTESNILHQFFSATYIHHCTSEPNCVREREGTNRASSQGIGRCNPERKFSKKEKRTKIPTKCTKDSARRCAGDGGFGICRGDPSKCGENLPEFIRGRRSSEHIWSRIVIHLHNVIIIRTDQIQIDIMQYRLHDGHSCRHSLPSKA
jgi:hypothetical protein